MPDDNTATSSPPRAIILDVDGTLIDSNDAHAQSWVETFEHFGYAVPYDRVRALIGKGGDKLLPETIGVEKDSDEGKKLGEWRSRRFREHWLPTLRPFPQARALLERLRHDGRTLVVASSAQREELGELLKQAGVDDLIEQETSSSDAARSKPDPDIVEAAIARSGQRPDRCVMIGDTPYDVTAARRAGIAVIALRCGGWDDADLGEATEIHDDPAALLAHYDHSLLGRGLAAA